MSKASAASKDTKAEKRAAKREQDHPDAAYIKREDIGVVVAKGLAVMYKSQPKNPVDFLAKWLLNYAQVEKHVLQGEEHVDKVKELRDKLEYQVSVERTEAEAKQKALQEEDIKTQLFWQKINFSSDLNDQLQDLADFLKTKSNATAVYIGKLVQPKKPISDEDDDAAHEDQSRNPIIHFLHSTHGHEYLVDKVLEQEQGLTFDVFKEEEVAQEEVILQEGEDGYEEQQARLRAKAQEEVLPRFVFVREVVREPRMHFFKVPKLGSYLAIRLEYESCLFEESLAAAVLDYIDVKQKQKEQDEEKRQYYEKLEEEKGDGEEGIEQPHNERQWEEIKPQPFQTRKIQFVVCLNTMGQDREFTEDEKKFALRTVRDYRDRWEQIERENLQSDIVRRVKRLQFDKEYKEHYDQVDAQALEKKVEEKLIPKEGEDALDDDTKQLMAKKFRFKILTKGFYTVDKPNKKPKFQVK